MTQTTGAEAAPQNSAREKAAVLTVILLILAVLTAAGIASLAFGLAGLTVTAVVAAWIVLATLVIMTAGN